MIPSIERHKLKHFAHAYIQANSSAFNRQLVGFLRHRNEELLNEILNSNTDAGGILEKIFTF